MKRLDINRRNCAIGAIVWLSVACGALPALAGDNQDFQAGYTQAWGHCRDALFYSDVLHPDHDAARAALVGCADGWGQMVERWSAKPPPLYQDDDRFAQELMSVADLAAQALRDIDAVGPGTPLGRVQADLQPLRWLLGEMRRHNGLESYTDILDAFDEKLAETLDAEFDGPDIPADQARQLTEQAGVLDYLAEKLEKRAPARLAEAAEFQDMAEELLRQVRGLRIALVGNQRGAVMAALADLRRHFDRFYLLYG